MNEKFKGAFIQAEPEFYENGFSCDIQSMYPRRNKMPHISFSHKYNKLRKKDSFVTTAILLDVISVELSQLSQEFLSYDTDYGTFKLPESGEYMMLIFLKDRENIFTTLRKYKHEKEMYYRENIGKEFEIRYVTPAANK